MRARNTKGGDPIMAAADVVAATRDGPRRLGARQLSSRGDRGSPALSMVLPEYAGCVFSGNRIRPRRERADTSTSHHVSQKHARSGRPAMLPAARQEPDGDVDWL